MVNSSDFVERLEYLLEYYNINASAFADKIHVQRSSISHLLTGRNKPSLEFVLKVIKSFPEVNLYWLLNGKGSFPSEESIEKQAVESKDETPSDPVADGTTLANLEVDESDTPSDRTIERIVIFYSDGSFKAYTG